MADKTPQNPENHTPSQKSLPPEVITPPVAKLALQDGTVFTGTAFGYTDCAEPIAGEVVFNTSMSGYQEILTDPSYTGQIVTMTYPLIGNYGVNTDDMESSKIQVAGFVIKELAHLPCNYRCSMRLEDWLEKQKILGIQGIDTRALVRKIRIKGAMNGVLSCLELDDKKLVEAARKAPSMVGLNLAKVASAKEQSQWTKDLGDWQPVQNLPDTSANNFKVVALDCGVKQNILRNLAQQGCEVTVMPHDSSAEEILAQKPDGLFISSGPGDPDPVTNTIKTLRQLHGKLPIFGICLGHQLLALSLGAKTYKLKFGHRGGNQPVQNLATKKVEITSQNHGFAVDRESLEAAGATPTHINLNDNTIEGFRHNKLPIFAVQYHPEASPGPHDSSYLFDCFIQMMTLSGGGGPTAQEMDSAQQYRNATLQA